MSDICGCSSHVDPHVHDEPGDPGRPIVGWVVLDPEGNVVQSGGVSFAEMDGRLAERVEQLRTEGEQ